jgi:mRNA interferase MazF
MTIIRGGELWIARILYTNGTDAKNRPVLVLWVDEQDIVVAVVTSASPRTVTDMLLSQWMESGLRVPSTVRLSRLDCLEISLFQKKVGQLSEMDATELKKVWQESIRLQF